MQQCSLLAHDSPGSEKAGLHAALSSRGSTVDADALEVSIASLSSARAILAAPTKRTEVAVGSDHQTGRTS
jgi:hypothetical protein